MRRGVEMTIMLASVSKQLQTSRFCKEIEALAQQYFAALDIPEKAKIDAFHLAVAAWHRMDYVLSWNCKHIASGRVQKMLQNTNARLGVYTPIVCTPEELME